MLTNVTFEQGKLPAFVSQSEFPFEPTALEVAPGETLSVVVHGSGPHLVFSHGTPTWSYEYRHLARTLRDRYTVVLIDHLGFGLSSRPRDADYSPEAHAARFAHALELLKVESYHLVAHDFGGIIALDGALRRPEHVRSVTLLNTFAWGFGDGPRTRMLATLAATRLFRFLYRRLNFSFVIAKSAWGKRRRADAFFPYQPLFSRPDDRELVLFALARSMKHSFSFAESIWERRRQLARVPMLILWGVRDSAFPLPALDKLARGFPHAGVVRFEDAGHWPHEEEPERATSTLAAFLGEVESGVRTEASA
jgi:haloalkane dehalogenase